MTNDKDMSIIILDKVNTSPFLPNSAEEKVLRKFERILAATHLVTKHISKTESIAERVRLIMDDIYTSVLNIKDSTSTQGELAVTNLFSDVRHAIGLLKLLSINGLLSPENADTLASALDEFGDAIHGGDLAVSYALTPTDFVVAPQGVRAAHQNQTATSHASVSKERRTSVSRAVPEAVASGDTARDAHTERSQEILNFLSKDSVVGIKDVCVRFPEYSEKMVQRELAKLVHEGVVKKVGEKRWSRYSLI